MMILLRSISFLLVHHSGCGTPAALNFWNVSSLFFASAQASGLLRTFCPGSALTGSLLHPQLTNSPY
jgi:hypothetical protein